MSYRIINGDSAKELKKFKDNSIDAVITDPPYGIEFLAKEWDQNTGAVEIWSECLRVLKPGGFLLAFSAARTYHILATNIQSVGFEIRDQIMWLYASGFPKAQDIGKAIDKRGVDNKWHGWKTALKPSHEPICMARKPFKGSTIDNVLKHNVGALNIDESRIGTEQVVSVVKTNEDNSIHHRHRGQSTPQKIYETEHQGRFPSNVIGEVEGYQKFFYCPKVSRKERHRGFEQIPDPISNYSQGDVKNHPLWDKSIGTNLQRLKHKIMEHNKDVGPKLDPLSHNVGNNHPTVKPVALMKYLIKLVAPQGAHILDPFAGSGSTGMAAKEMGYKFTGIEMDKNYCDIAKRRIDASKTDQFDKLFDDTIVNE